MRLSAIRVRNFRCITDETLQFDALTVLVGANGAGKSAFLQALNHFYEGSVGITLEDFYNRDTSEPIEITVTYNQLSDDEKDALERYVHDDALRVLLRIRWITREDVTQGAAVSNYHGWTARHDAFQRVREAGNAPDRLKALRELFESEPGRYDFTPDTGAWGRAESQMVEWEQAHPDQCSLQEDGGDYFRAPNAGTGPLAERTELIFVPAVRAWKRLASRSFP